MIDIYTISVYAVIIVAVLSFIAVLATIISAWNGSIRRYRQQRDEHYQQYYRIRQQLDKGRH